MQFLKSLVARPQPHLGTKRVIMAGIGGALTIGLLGLLAELTGSVLIVASLGASCVLVFTAPGAPLSQPMNVVGGHLLTTLCGLVVGMLFGTTWWSVALAVGLAIIVMAALRITHPPAGANPIFVMTTGATWSFLLTPVLAGALIVVVMGILFHRFAGIGTTYPLKPQK